MAWTSKRLATSLASLRRQHLVGNHLALKYDDFGRLVEETDPLGRTISYKHHFATPLVTETRFPDGSVWTSRYDNKGNLIAEIDPLGHKTEYLNGEDGLPHTIIDANFKSKYLWWNAYAQPWASGGQAR
ncbi:RHS repeat protein [Pseudomonas sp. GM84]|nr:RHS repeat domain-containing protein [Pseudomonas sp. GM84]EJN33830.1 RHS repeat protein [Pseudomonas sp. GM84]